MSFETGDPLLGKYSESAIWEQFSQPVVCGPHMTLSVGGRDTKPLASYHGSRRCFSQAPGPHRRSLLQSQDSLRHSTMYQIESPRFGSLRTRSAASCRNP